MTIFGRNAIEHVELAIRTKTDDEIRSIADSFADSTRADLEVHGSESLATGLFETWRRFAREEKSARARNLGDGEHRDSGTLDDQTSAAEAVCSHLMNSGSWSAADAWHFYSVHEAGFQDSARKLHQARTTATYLLAVLRPFKDRYLTAWANQTIGFPIDSVRAKISSLLSEHISDANSLKEWLTSVYELFAETAVFRPSATSPAANGEGLHNRPVGYGGQISPGSERIYRQKWFAWVRENAEYVYQVSSALSHQRATYGTSNRANSSSRAMLEPRSDMGASKPDFNRVEITVQCGIDSSLKASRIWNNPSEASLELSTWLDMIQDVWADKSNDVLGTFLAEGEGGKLELNTPSMPIHDAKKTLANLIKRLA